MQVDLIDRVLAAAGILLRPIIYMLLAMPAIIVVAASFTAGDGLSFPPEGFSLRWYDAAFKSDVFMASLWTSVKLACIATVFSLGLGLLATLALDRAAFPGKSVFRTLALSPLIVPMVVLGLGLLQFLSWLHLSQSFAGLLIGHILITLPYVVRTLTAGIVLFDRTLEQAAANLRAPPLRVLRTITLPLMAPSLVSAGVFAFVTSFGNITLSVFLGFGGETTLPVQIFAYVEHNYDPVLAAVSTLVILVTLAVVLIVEKMVGMDKVT